MKCSAAEIDNSPLRLHERKQYLAFKDLKEGLTKKNIAEKFSVPQDTLTYCIKHKEDIISKYESGQFGAKRKVKC